jgi:ankyrin repeat protein
VKFLLGQAGVDPNEKDFQDFTALHYATIWGWTSTIRILLDAGADPNAATTAGKTALMYAVEFDNEQLVHWFASQSKKIGLRVDATVRESGR